MDGGTGKASKIESMRHKGLAGYMRQKQARKEEKLRERGKWGPRAEEKREVMKVMKKEERRWGTNLVNHIC